VRGGALEYVPFERERISDGQIFAADGTVLSPIDEFGAPLGAGLCGECENRLEDGSCFYMPPIFPMGQLRGSEGLVPYQSCMTLDVITDTLGLVMDLPFEPMPACALTRTTVSAARLGELLLVTIPGEPVTLLADWLRSQSPVAPERTVVVGYAQGSIGYVLTPEDWLRGGYEPSINGWGPLEGQYVAERAVEMMMLASTDEREDAAQGGVDRYAPEPRGMELPPPDAAPMAGTVPSPVPELVYVRGGMPVASAQPPSTVPRLESARFVWIGEDPISGTPRVTLEREATPGAGDFAPVTRRSGRIVEDLDLLLTHTHDPLERTGTEARTHYWAVEWQAVTPFGTAGMDALADRPGVPLGRYRFRVHGTSYTIESDPFEVVAGALDVTASLSGTAIAIDVGYLASGGFRLLDLEARSNERVPHRGGAVTVALILSDASEREITDVAVGMDGTASADAGADAAMVERVRVTDRFGNAGEAPVM
jgi:neutral ceramidase